MNESKEFRLADAVSRDRLLQPIADWMADRRDAGLSDTQIAEAIDKATDGVIQVTRNTVNAWIVYGGHPSRAEYNAQRQAAA